MTRKEYLVEIGVRASDTINACDVMHSCEMSEPIDLWIRALALCIRQSVDLQLANLLEDA